MKLLEVAQLFNINQEVIIQFINEEWIEPLDLSNLILDEDDLARIQLILELQEQLGVNNESVPIILHLIDQLNHLHLALMHGNKMNE